MDYKVTFSRALGLHSRTLGEVAINEGRGEALVEAAHHIVALLRATPHSAGEVLYHLRTGAPVTHVVSGPLSAHAAVYAADHLVEVFRLDLMSPRM